MRWWPFLFIIFLFAQSDSKPPASFIPPVKGLIQLTGTFGELRSGHFHAGLDIRGGVGRAIYAISDGFVSRIKVSVSGYGQALYLQHPSGHTSVYGHLDRFRDDMANFVKTQQYTNESFLLDEELDIEQFPVQQGDLIGYIGQRGFVSGPHLHFEIRDTDSGRLLNPMNFGIRAADNRRPLIRGLRVFELDKRGNVLHAENKKTQAIGSGKHRLSGDTIFVHNTRIGLGLKTYDQQDGRPNLNGVYEIKLSQGDSLVFGFKMDHFDGEQSRYLNAHLDYKEKLENDSWYNSCFRLPGNQLDFYQHNNHNGQIHLRRGEHKNFTFDVRDIEGNHSFVEFVVKRVVQPIRREATFNYFLPFDKENLIENQSIRTHFHENTLYEDLYLDYDLIVENTQGLYSPMHRLHTHTTPLHRYFDLHIRPNHISESLKDKAIIVHCEDGDSPTSYGGEWTAEGRLRAPVRNFGNFGIMIDTIPPEIQIHHFSKDMRGWSQFSFSIDDNFPTAGKAKGLRFRAEVDGQWILMEYNGRKKRLYHDFDGHILKGKHHLKLRIKDDRGNERILEREFIR